MLDEATDAMSVGEDPDVLRQYEQKLLADEQIAELQQLVEDKDKELEELRSQLDHTTDEHKLSLQRLTDAENQVYLITCYKLYLRDVCIPEFKNILWYYCGITMCDSRMRCYGTTCSCYLFLRDDGSHDDAVLTESNENLLLGL